MTKFTFSQAFAEALGVPFNNGSRIGLLIAKARSTLEDFTSDPANWFSEKGYKYTEREMGALWRMIVEQKKRVEAFWLVEQGLFPAYNPARKTLDDAS